MTPLLGGAGCAPQGRCWSKGGLLSGRQVLKCPACVLRRHGADPVPKLLCLSGRLASRILSASSGTGCAAVQIRRGPSH